MPKGFRLKKFFALFERYRGFIIIIGVMGLPMVIIRPMPTQVMDFLLMMNITLAMLVLLTTIYVEGPLQFSSLPSLLLITTLFRLVLNVATTRLILGKAGEFGDEAAGQIIMVFGTFVAGNDIVVGVIIFAILVIIQFVVITKGATRISEVAARFTLDGMPGKQMAIDADLNAGLIGEDEAKKRRSDITREADFYGAMDGASKFVRGDAVAGIIITFINILGGFLIGWAKYGMSPAEAANVFTRLTVGDGLVTQLPAFIISVAAGLIVTRSTSTSNLGEELSQQLTSQPRALQVTAGFLLLLAMSKMPKIPSFFFAAACGGIAYLVTQVRANEAMQKTEDAEKKVVREPEQVQHLLKVDPMELEVGYGLIKLVDVRQGGDLLDRVTMIRRQMATEFGIIVPPIRIRDNMQLEPNTYGVKIKGVTIAAGECMPDYHLAMDAGVATGKIDGIETTEPAFGLPAVWVTETQKSKAEALGYTVVDGTSVIATHLTEVIKQNASALLTLEQVSSLLETQKNTCPTLVNDVIPDKLKPGELQKILQNLLRERVSIRDLESILEAVAGYAERTKDMNILTEYARHALSRTICAQYADGTGRLHVLTVDPSLEEEIKKSIEHTDSGSYTTLSPNLVKKVVDTVAGEIGKLVSLGHQAVILCSPQIRQHLKKLTESALPALAVLSYNEVIRDVNVESHGMVGVDL